MQSAIKQGMHVLTSPLEDLLCYIAQRFSASKAGFRKSIHENVPHQIDSDETDN